MAVEFKDDRFVITIHTGCNPIEEWLELHAELLRVLTAWGAESHIMETPWRMFGLLEDMMPEHADALKMHPIKKKE